MNFSKVVQQTRHANCLAGERSTDMPLAAQPEVLRPTVEILRRACQNDEAITSDRYAKVMGSSLERIYRSTYWTNSARFEEARQQLSSTASLERDWDTYGAEPPSDQARQGAASILDALEAAALPPSRISPSAEGGVAVSFVEGDKRALIEIYNTGEAAAATYSDEGSPVVWELDGTPSSVKGAIERIRVHLAA